MALRVLEQCQVSPPPVSGLRPAIPLTFFDMPWLDLNPVERLFFYQFPRSTTDFIASHLPNIKSSLSQTLNNFYPLAGTIRPSSVFSDQFEMRYSDGDSVSLTVCEYENVDFSDVSGYHARPFEKLLSLVPSLPKSPDAQPLLAVQVTLFPNQGICLAVNIHHAACDGSSSIHFLKSWAAFSRAAPPPPPPILDRSFISDPRSLCAKFAQAVVLQRSQPPQTPATSPLSTALTCATFTLPSHQIQSLKQRLHSIAVERLRSTFHISTFVISAAWAWICIVKAKGYDTDFSRMAYLLFSVDWRSRMRPPPPVNYFGNCLGSPCIVKASVREIVEEKDGFFMTCEAIGKAIENIGDDVHEELDGVTEKVMKVFPLKPLTIAGSPRLRVYECDFGWGKPVKVEVTSIGRTGAVSLAESRDDVGGVEIGVVLPADEVVEFEKYFYKFPFN